jgi:C-terminal processing protease CtpA/Prc
MAELICENIQQHAADGDYDDITDGEFFAFALTTHMQETSRDEHLWVRWHEEPLPDEPEALRLNRQWVAQQRLQAEISNYGFDQLERMAGNIGYAAISYFQRAEWGGETAAAAMNFLANTDALIFDLQGCTGGYSDMVGLVSSYLLGRGHTLLNSIYWRDDDQTRQYWTLPYIQGRYLNDKPLYILTSKKTFSAGEGFAYDMQARKRAVIIGEQTDGGAHPGASYRLDQHFEVFIPIGLPTHPITGTNWERRGVTPDFPVPAEQALSTAYKLALKEQIEKLGKPASRPRKLLLREALKAYQDLQEE